MTGLYFEELEVGREFDHEIRRTVTETDNLLFSTMTHNPQPLHLDAEFARQTHYGQILVNSWLCISLSDYAKSAVSVLERNKLVPPQHLVCDFFTILPTNCGRQCRQSMDNRRAAERHGLFSGAQSALTLSSSNTAGTGNGQYDRCFHNDGPGDGSTGEYPDFSVCPGGCRSGKTHACALTRAGACFPRSGDVPVFWAVRAGVPATE